MTIVNPSVLSKLLKQEVQEFIISNFDYTPSEIILKHSSNNNLPVKEIAEQIECIKKAQKKIPHLSKNKLIYKKVPLDQSSSELTALYKSH